MVSCTCVIEVTIEFKFINTIMAHIHIVSHDYCDGLWMEWLIIYLCLLNAALIEDLQII